VRGSGSACRFRAPQVKQQWYTWTTVSEVREGNLAQGLGVYLGSRQADEEGLKQDKIMNQAWPEQKDSWDQEATGRIKSRIHSNRA
jgi:hypothetical protein